MPGAGSSDFNCSTGRLVAVGAMASAFGFVEICAVEVERFEVAGVGGGEVGATDLRTCAANSARVAGSGRPGPQSR